LGKAHRGCSQSLRSEELDYVVCCHVGDDSTCYP
jgi:hypothetical protein